VNAPVQQVSVLQQQQPLNGIVETQAISVQPVVEPAASSPVYLGTFSKVKNNVEGDIFMLDESTLYIQGFSFDGQAPDVYFWSEGVPIPYYTRLFTFFNVFSQVLQCSYWFRGKNHGSGGAIFLLLGLGWVCRYDVVLPFFISPYAG